VEAAGENWRNVDSALRQGCRGLAGGSSLSRILKRYRAAGERRGGYRRR
jgi:hypothetical protein